MGAKSSIYFYVCSLNNKIFEGSDRTFSECHKIMFVNNDFFLGGGSKLKKTSNHSFTTEQNFHTFFEKMIFQICSPKLGAFGY